MEQFRRGSQSELSISRDRRSKMALPMAAARGPLWRLGPSALSPARGRIPPPLAPAVSSFRSPSPGAPKVAGADSGLPVPAAGARWVRSRGCGSPVYSALMRGCRCPVCAGLRVPVPDPRCVWGCRCPVGSGLGLPVPPQYVRSCRHRFPVCPELPVPAGCPQVPGVSGADSGLPVPRAFGTAAPRCPVRCPVRSLSSRAASRALVAAVAGAARRVSARYERYLERSWPRFFLLHSTFKNGVQALVLEVQEIRRIRARMAQQQLSPQQLPYRDMERLRQFRRDVLKAIPIGIIAIPPFANFLVLLLMYFFPRQLLIRHFWTPRQRLEFLDAYDRRRRASHGAVLRALAQAARSLPEARPQQLLLQLCEQVQGGARPHLAQLLAVRSSFSGSLLVLNRLQVDHVRALSRVLFLTPHLPAFVLRRRLRSHVLEIRQLDRALLRLGLGQLSEEELRAACYLRGLNSTPLGRAQCQAWLEQWLRLSCQLQASEASLLAHSMVLLALEPCQPPRDSPA
ncbi:LETM1 domain-containing protein 1 [Melospiza melodia melodia]|uniref:LETM1 domain-containing protein 1 n=1 Tax=Melospiza melodia melodia TaxID=1914991 RepID=UPI002FD01E55